MKWYVRIYFGRFYTFVGTGDSPENAKADAIEKAALLSLNEDMITKECEPYSKKENQIFRPSLWFGKPQ